MSLQQSNPPDPPTVPNPPDLPNVPQSPLHPGETGLGAESGDFVERFGRKLPRVYTDAASEYRAATEGAALHDNSYTGRLKASGDDALDLLNRLSTNLVVNLSSGRGAPTILTTDRGRIIDLLGVVNTGEYTLLLTSPDSQQRVIDWLDKYTIMEDLTVTDLTPETALLTVCGPQSEAALNSVLQFEPTGEEGADGADLASLQPYSGLSATVGGNNTDTDSDTDSDTHPVMLIRRPLGELPAFDLVMTPQAAPVVWQRLAAAGVTPIGQEAFEAVQVRHAVPRYGRELGDAFNPLEAGLIGSVDFAKGCYIGQEVIARLDTYEKVQRYLVRLRFSAGAVVSEGAVLEQEGRNVGQVTSLSVIPTTGELLGLGYIRTAAAQSGAQLTLAAPAQGSAEIADLPQFFGPGED